MNSYYLIAGILTILLGIAHSFFGEYLIFRHYRKNNELVPTQTTGELRERHLRILWASWHLTTFLGFGLGAVMVYMAFHFQTAPNLVELLRVAIAGSTLLGAVLVAFATQLRHPGWIVLLAITILIFMGG